MSEYIIWESDKTETTDYLGVKHGVSHFEKREEIVRCRDCKYYDEIIHACERFDSIKQDNVSYVFDDDFCAWAVRRDA